MRRTPGERAISTGLTDLRVQVANCPGPSLLSGIHLHVLGPCFSWPVTGHGSQLLGDRDSVETAHSGLGHTCLDCWGISHASVHLSSLPPSLGVRPTPVLFIQPPCSTACPGRGWVLLSREGGKAEVRWTKKKGETKCEGPRAEPYKFCSLSRRRRSQTGANNLLPG